jgi:hypothetical protein
MRFPVAKAFSHGSSYGIITKGRDLKQKSADTSVDQSNQLIINRFYGQCLLVTPWILTTSRAQPKAWGRKIMVKLDEALALAIQATGGPEPSSGTFQDARAALINDWALWCRDKCRGDGALKYKSVKDYLRNIPDSCTPRTAWSLFQFVETALVSGQIVDATAYSNLLALIDAPVTTHRAELHRYPLQNDDLFAERLDSFNGVYVVFRFETGHKNFQQELLLLSPKDKATYIRPQIIYRGTWHVLDSVLACTLAGCADSGNPKMNSLVVTHDGSGESDIMCGALVGVATLAKWAVVMPLVVVRIANAPEAWLNIANLSDAVLRQSFNRSLATIGADDKRHDFLKAVSEKFSAAKREPFELIDPVGYVGAIRNRLPDSQEAVDPRIVEWLGKHAGRRSRQV